MPRASSRPLLDRQDAVACSVHHERGDAHRGQHGPDVCFPHHPQPGLRRGGTRAVHEHLVPARLGLRVVGDRRCPELEQPGVVAPAVADLASEPPGDLVGRVERVVVALHPARRAAIEHQGLGALRIGGGEQAAEHGPLGDPEQHRAFAARSLHDRPQVVHPLFEGGEVVGRHAVGEARAPLVPHDHPTQRAQPLHPADVGGVVEPSCLHRPHPPRGDQDVGLALAGHLVGQPDVPVPRVTDAGGHRRYLAAPCQTSKPTSQERSGRWSVRSAKRSRRATPW